MKKTLMFSIIFAVMLCFSNPPSSGLVPEEGDCSCMIDVMVGPMTNFLFESWHDWDADCIDGTIDCGDRWCCLFFGNLSVCWEVQCYLCTYEIPTPEL